MYQELKIKNLSANNKEVLVELLSSFNCLGTQEFSIDEKRVDEILGSRSYSGGDLPDSVIEEVENILLNDEFEDVLFYFNPEENIELVTKFLKENNFGFTLENQMDKDWNEEWRKHYAPILVTNDLEIIPSWMEDYKSNATHKLMLYPGQGFGTGSHETTFLCLKLLMENNLNPKNVLDFGAGSGILGIATQKIFNSSCDYYDIDENAIKNNLQNLELNNIKDNYRLMLPENRTEFLNKYELIFANILKPVLIDEVKNLKSKLSENGSIILSGLLVEQMDEVQKIYENHGFKFKTELRKNDWGAMLLGFID